MKQLFKYLPEQRNLFDEGFIRLSQPVVLSAFDKIMVQGRFATSIGCLDVWKAVKNNDYYSLAFMKI